jgi:hypothetical protein
MVLKSSWNASMTKDCTNGIEPIGAPRIQKLVLRVRKHGRTNMFNYCGNQATHFVN